MKLATIAKQLDKLASSTKLLIPQYASPPAWNPTKRIQSYKGHVYAAIDILSDSVADIKFVLKQGTPANWKEVEAHPILDLIYNPSDLFDKDNLIKLSIIYYELCGEVFWYTAPNEMGIPTMLFPLMPHKVTVIPAKENEPGLIAGYRYMTINGQLHDFKVEEIAYMRNPHPENPLRGMSVIEAAALAIDTDIFAAEYNRDFFYNSAVPLGGFSTETSLSDETFNRLKSEIKATYGRSKAHTPAILEGGMEWLDIGLKQKDMDFLEGRKFTRDEIFEIFKVPKSLVTTEDVNRSNADAGERQFAKRVVKRLDNRLVTFLNATIVKAFGAKNLFLDFEDPTPSDIEQNRQLAESGKNTGALSYNEMRKLLGQDISDDPNADIPIGLLPTGATIQPIKRLSGKGTNITTVHMSTLQFIEQRIAETVQKYVVEAVNKPVIKAVEIGEPSNFVVFTETEKAQIWKALDTRSNDFIKLFHGELIYGLSGQEQRITRKVESGNHSDSIMNLPGERVSFISILVPTLHRILSYEGNKTLDFLGSTDQVFDMEAARIVRYLSDYGLRFIDYMNGYTKELLIESLSEGVKNGESIPQLSNRVTQIYGDAKGYRAKAIARTEVGNAVSNARLEAYRQSKATDGKTWLTARDADVRDSHQALEGVTVKLNERFANGCMAPKVCDSAGEKINCRCDLLPKLKSGSKYYIPKVKSLFSELVSPDYSELVLEEFANELNQSYYICTNKVSAFDWRPKFGTKLLSLKS